MAMLKQQHWIGISYSLACLLLTACGTTQPSRFYMLTSIPETAVESSSSQDETNIHIGVGPITVPKYLDRYPIVKRSDGAEVIINDIHRWAEPLADNFTRVVAHNLDLLVDTSDISIHPWRDSNEIDYQVVVELLRFDADIHNNIVLSAHWTIYGKNSHQSLFKQKTLITEKADNDNYATLVSTQSSASGKLCMKIAEKLNEIIAQGSSSQ